MRVTRRGGGKLRVKVIVGVSHWKEVGGGVEERGCYPSLTQPFPLEECP